MIAMLIVGNVKPSDLSLPYILSHRVLLVKSIYSGELIRLYDRGRHQIFVALLTDGITSLVVLVIEFF